MYRQINKNKTTKAWNITIRITYIESGLLECQFLLLHIRHPWYNAKNTRTQACLGHRYIAGSAKLLTSTLSAVKT